MPSSSGGDRLFRPRRCGGREGALLCTFPGDGATPSGIVLQKDERTMHNLAVVLDVTRNWPREVCEPGDAVLFAEGAAEPLVTAAGEKLFWCAAEQVLDLFDPVL